MKITGIKLYNYISPYTAKWPGEARSCGPLDIYPEYGRSERNPYMMRGVGGAGAGEIAGAFLAVTTDEGVSGIHGPIAYRSQLLVAADGLSGHIAGRDPLENRMLWDIMSRFDRHARSGLMLMAISAVDIALWDLKGKILGEPVYRLLGGGRNKLRPYISTLGFSIEPGRAREKALEIREMGFGAQKWFFRYGPGDGAAGMRKNLELAFLLREALGDDYELMFDCWMGWDIAYAKTIFRELRQVNPMWVEEALRPHMQDGYRILKAETDIPLSAGEHLYTRMEANAYLRDGVFDVMQSDPEWCGGITEALRIADLCEMYGTRFIPHGHSFYPGMHVVASMPPDICPYVECLLQSYHGKTHFFRHAPMGSDGFLNLGNTPGIGEEIDMEKVARESEITEFAL
jgi:L-alanine-DL-glutamate epimerase-like enolase superfamily enzyme